MLLFLDIDSWEPLEGFPTKKKELLLESFFVSQNLLDSIAKKIRKAYIVNVERGKKKTMARIDSFVKLS